MYENYMNSYYLINNVLVCLSVSKIRAFQLRKTALLYIIGHKIEKRKNSQYFSVNSIFLDDQSQCALSVPHYFYIVKRNIVAILYIYISIPLYKWYTMH